MYTMYTVFGCCFPDKQKVLKHHPDKRKARGVKVKEGEDDYFTCITRGKMFMMFIFFTSFSDLPTIQILVVSS